MISWSEWGLKSPGAGEKEKGELMKKFLNAVAVLGLTAMAAMAVAADPDTIVTDATTTFEAVTTLVVAMVGFFIIVRIVKGIRK